jgi:hypothetical protein
MAYKCPRCGGPVQRGSGTAAGVTGGAVGAMLYAAFGPLLCKDCGTVSRSEFPAEDRRRMLLGSIGLVLTVVVLLVALLVLLVLLSRR